MKNLRFPLAFILFSLVGCTASQETFTRAMVIETLDQAVGGPKAMAREGDFLLENDKIRLAILAGGTSMGSGLYGGSLVDADLQRWDVEHGSGHGNDIFGELFPTVNMNVATAFDVDDVTIVNDGSNGEAAVIRVTAPATGFLTMLNGLWGIMGVNSFQMVHDWILEPGVPYLRMRTIVTAGDVEPATEAPSLPAATADMPLLEYALETGMVQGDFYLSGGSLDVFTPGVGFDESGEVYAASQSGRNTFREPFVVDYIASAGEGVSYGIAPLEGTMLIPMFTSDQTASVGAGIEGDGTGARFEDGVAWSYERVFVLGQGDVASVYDAILEARGTSTGSVSGNVLEMGSMEPLSEVNVLVYKGAGKNMESRPWSSFKTDVGMDNRPDGSFQGKLPEGTWTLIPHRKGWPTGAPLEIDVQAGKESTVVLALPRTGGISVDIVDETGIPVPAKVTVLSTTGVSLRDPVMGDGYLAGGATEILFGADGHVEAHLPPGEYQVVATRGPEYELAHSPIFVLGDHDLIDLKLQVLRSVQTPGWVSADFHAHSDTSFDSGLSSINRVTSMAAEGVEFFLSTDHDYITNHAPSIEKLGLEPWLRTEIGVEISPVELGHYLSFPVDIDYLAEAHGAFDWTDMTPDQIIASARALGQPDGIEPLVMLPHARDGILGLFDQYGLDPYTSTNGDISLRMPTLSLFNPLLKTDNFTLDFNAMEVMNGKRFELIRSPTQGELDAYAAGGDIDGFSIIARTMEEQQALIDGTEELGYSIKGHVDDWFTLLNLGYRITAISNSDSHDTTGIESGCPRNYVVSTTDDPAAIDSEEIAQAIVDHRVLTTTGPFITFEANGEPIGSELVSPGSVELYIEVQTPTWYDVDRVELYENGTLIQEWSVPQENQVVDFAETVEVTPTQDSWYVVIALGQDSLAPLFSPVDRPYVQLQDVVVDAFSGIKSLPISLSPPVERPRGFPIYPYALTNPIWVDVNGDGWTPPGLPSWLRTPPEPKEKEL